MQTLINEYFKNCEGTPLLSESGRVLLDTKDRPIILDAKPPTITGLALALGFRSRQTLLNYGKDEAFADVISFAKMRIEEYLETRLLDRDGSGGAKFNLINSFEGWQPERLLVPEDDDEKGYGFIEAAAAPDFEEPEEIPEDEMPEDPAGKLPAGDGS